MSHAPLPSRQAPPRINLLPLLFSSLPLLCSAGLIRAADISPGSVIPPPNVTLFSNLGQPASSPSTLFGEIFATGFMTGPDATLLTGLTLKLANDSPALIESAPTFLYDDSSGRPGSLLGTFSPINLRVEPFQLDVLISFGHAGLYLQPHHAYWIGLTSPDNLGWWNTGSFTSDQGSAGPIQSSPLLPLMITSDEGATWLDGPGYTFMYSLSGQVVD